MANQYRLPAPPVEPWPSWLQPREGWAEFQEAFPPPVRSKWPSCAVPVVLEVQLLHVWSAASGYAVPSGREPVRMSCWLGWSPKPLGVSPFSVRTEAFETLAPRRANSSVSPCSSCRLRATSWPLALYQGPSPMRSRALITVLGLSLWVLR